MAPPAVDPQGLVFGQRIPFGVWCAFDVAPKTPSRLPWNGVLKGCVGTQRYKPPALQELTPLRKVIHGVSYVQPLDFNQRLKV